VNRQIELELLAVYTGGIMPRTRSRFARRAFLRGSLSLAGLGLLSGCGLLPPQAPAPERVRLIGVIGEAGGRWDAFWDGLRELGWVEGQNLAVEFRWAGEDTASYRALATELVERKVELIVVGASVVAVAAKQATATVPLVTILVSGEAIESGLVDNIARPSGNITGVAGISGSQLEGKQLQLLKEAVPHVFRVAVLRGNPDPSSSSERRVRALQEAAPGLGVDLHVVAAPNVGDLDDAFAAMSTARADALKILNHNQYTSAWGRIAELALQYRLPAISESPDFARAGGLLGYGLSRPEIYRSAAPYVDKILRGARPGDLPMERPSDFEFVINLGTAQALGLTIPQPLLAEATELIQ
jgi:putative ABC transport system substrate-binding protein